MPGFHTVEEGEINEFPYRITFNEMFEIHNGYLAVPQGHPWYRVDYPSCDVHGGVTYTAEDEEQHLWWIGFDCGHFKDIVPGIDKVLKELGREPFHFPGATYKDRDFVYDELVSLVMQAEEVELLAMQKGKDLGNQVE